MLKLSFSITLLLITFCGISQTIDLAWGAQTGGTQNERSQAIAADDLGNTYVTGHFFGTIDFDPGIGILNLTSNGLEDSFIQKLDADGNLLWAKNIGGSQKDRGFGVSIDQFNNVFITGYFQGTVDFDPGTGVNAITTSGTTDAFLLKLDENGDFVWVKSFGGSSGDGAGGYDVEIDQSNNICITGLFKGLTDFDPNANTSHLNATTYDVFVVKLTEQGNFIWAKAYGSWATDDFPQSISIDNLNNLIITGYFEGGCDFDPGAGIEILTSNGNTDISIVKLDANGNYIWASSFGGPGEDQGKSVAVDSENNIYCTGNFYSTVDFDASAGVHNLTSNGDTDFFALKLNPNGQLEWASAFGSITGEYSYSIDIDQYDYVNLSGTFSNSMDVDPGPNVQNVSASGASIIVLKLNKYGEYVGHINFGTDGISEAFMAVNSLNKIVVTAVFIFSNDFDPSMNDLTFTPIGGWDYAVFKFDQCDLTFGTDQVTACDSLTWIDGLTYNSSIIGPTYNVIGSSGCDSILTLDLSIVTKTLSSMAETACNYYISPSGDSITSSAIYSDTIMNTAGCDSIITIDLTIDYVDVSVSQSGATLTANAIGATYQWIDCSNGYSPILGETNQSFTPAATSGSYAVEVSNGSCTVVSICYGIDFSSLITPEKLDQIYVFPNPFEESLSIILPNNFKTVELKLMNVQGEMLENRIVLENGSNEFNIGQDIPKGIYFLHFSSSNEKKILKIVKN